MRPITILRVRNANKILYKVRNPASTIIITIIIILLSRAAYRRRERRPDLFFQYHSEIVSTYARNGFQFLDRGDSLVRVDAQQL